MDIPKQTPDKQTFSCNSLASSVGMHSTNNANSGQPRPLTAKFMSKASEFRTINLT